MSNGKTVWTPEDGWAEDGPEVMISLDDKGRLATDSLTAEQIDEAYVARLTHALAHGLTITEAEEWAESDNPPELTPSYLDNLEEARWYNTTSGPEMDRIYDDTIASQGYWAE